MFTVKNRVNLDANIGRYFTEWEAQEAADELNTVHGTTSFYVEGRGSDGGHS